ncbi:MAG: S24 family peptidase [Ardenticatenales bacterium]
MNVLPAAIDLIVRPQGDANPPVRRGRTRPARRGLSRRPAQLPLALARGVGSAARTVPSPVPAPAVDALAVAGALWAHVTPGAAVTRLTPPAEGWPDAFVRPEDVVLVALGGAVSEGALAAVRLRVSDAVLVRRVHGLGDHHVRLQPEDRTVPPLVLPAADIDIMGPVVTIARGVSAAVPSQRRTA